jgi:hypothetical protein
MRMGMSHADRVTFTAWQVLVGTFPPSIAAVAIWSGPAYPPGLP